MLETMRRLRSAALRDNYGYERLAHLSDNIGPRPVGSRQAAAAVDYVADELRTLGFNVRLEKVRVPQWIRGEDHCELVKYPGQVPGTTQKIVVAALGGLGVATPRDGITAEDVQRAVLMLQAGRPWCDVEEALRSTCPPVAEHVLESWKDDLIQAAAVGTFSPGSLRIPEVP